jgi:hypothetical protein
MLPDSRWVTPFEYALTPPNAVSMEAQLVRSPFKVDKVVSLSGGVLRVDETVQNVGAETIEVMWGQHPAFGSPLVGPDALVTTSDFIRASIPIASS